MRSLTHVSEIALANPQKRPDNSSVAGAAETTHTTIFGRMAAEQGETAAWKELEASHQRLQPTLDQLS